MGCRMLKAFRELLNRRPSERPKGEKETELLATRIGLALIACQLVERNLYGVMTQVLGEKWNRKQRPKLVEMIQRLRGRGPAMTAPAQVLDEFREKRNEFVHALLDLEGADLRTSEGKMVCYGKAVEVHAMASVIMKTFGTIFRDHFTALGHHWPQHLSGE